MYDVPWFDFGHIFELPLMGYAVFMSVSLELYAISHLALGLLGYGDREILVLDKDTISL